MNLNRRRVLGGVGTAVALGLAGCTNSVPDDAVRELPTPTLGKPDASVTVQVFEDFACPHCADFTEQVTPRLVENHVSTGSAKLQLHDYPLPVSEFSWPAAMAGRSVQDRGGIESFYTFAQFLFANQASLGWDLIAEAANEVGVAGDAVVADAKDNKYRPVVQADKDLGKSIGVSSTPTVLVNGEAVAPQGSTYDEYYRAIAGAIDTPQ
jgi:protein-disulfide isomerase